MDLSVNTGVNAYSAVDSTSNTSTKEASKEESTKKTSEEKAAVYEKSDTKKKDSANQIYNRDSIVAKLKADQQSRVTSMQSLVEKLLNKQKGTFDLANATGLASTFRNAAKYADADTIKQAQKDISEDGYWGVNKTSDRLVSMAIALAGGDPEKADEMMAAIQKGFDKATAAWGEKLPQICQDTLDATKQKMEDWKTGKTTAQDYADYLS